MLKEPRLALWHVLGISQRQRQSMTGTQVTRSASQGGELTFRWIPRPHAMTSTEAGRHGGQWQLTEQRATRLKISKRAATEMGPRRARAYMRNYPLTVCRWWWCCSRTGTPARRPAFCRRISDHRCRDPISLVSSVVGYFSQHR